MSRVFIGVGHGGRDPGAVAGGLRESDVNLGVALAMREELRRCGVETGISRTGDVDDPLAAEIAAANAFRPDVAVEVHHNAGGGKGFEVYRQTGAFGPRSLALARSIEDRVTAMGQNSRGVKIRTNGAGQDYFGWLRQVNCPAVLCEGAFLDHGEDRQTVATPEKQAALGRAYARGVLDYLGVSAPPAVAEPTPIRYRVVEQHGAFAEEARAKTLVAQLRAQGRYAYILDR